MKIGVIGVCNITLDFAERAASSGHEVLISHNRCNKSLKPIVERMGKKVKLVSKDKAAKAKMIILFITREDLKTFFDDLPDMSEKILLHTNHPLFNMEPPASNGDQKSSTEIIASLLPDAHVIKIYNAVNPAAILPICKNPNGNELFFTGANMRAKNKLKTFLKTINFSGCDLEEYQQGCC